MGIEVIEVKKDMKIFCMPFDDLLFDASHDLFHKSFGKTKVFVVPNKYGITKKDDLLTWINPKINRYEKIVRMHEMGKWQQVPLPKKVPVTGKELYVYIDFLEKESDVIFVFVKAVN